VSYFDNLADPSAPLQDFHQMRVLALLGDSVTTDDFRGWARGILGLDVNETRSSASPSDTLVGAANG
jgi:hypothetical protein